MSEEGGDKTTSKNMEGDLKEEIKKLKEQLESLKKQITESYDDEDQPLSIEKYKTGETKIPFISLRQRRRLAGHYGKISAMHWGGEGTKKLVSVSQDGKLIVWDAFLGTKINVIPLRSHWVMTCAFSNSEKFAASGGLDNLCTIHGIPDNEGKYVEEKPHRELKSHEGYLSCARFIENDAKILTSSGDNNCKLWDIENGEVINTFSDHTGDVMCVSPFEGTKIFISGSCDKTSVLWDYRSKNKVVSFPGHEADVNSVEFFPNGNAFASASEDSTCRLFDIRAKQQIQRYGNEKIKSPVTSLAFSRTGSHLFAGYGDFHFVAWDTPTAEIVQDVNAHHDRISTLALHPDGTALCTGSWDMTLSIWSS